MSSAQASAQALARQSQQRSSAAKAHKAKKGEGASIKVSNLAPSTSSAMLKDALESWGVTGIGDVKLSEVGRSGPVAIVSFRTLPDAEVAMQADGVTVDNRPLQLEMIATVAKPKAEKNEPESGGKAARGVSEQEPDSIRVLGVPREADKNDVVKFLRQFGVLGISEVDLPEAEKGSAYVRFQTPENVKSALAKVPEESRLKGQLITVEVVPYTDPEAELPVIPGGDVEAWEESLRKAAAGKGKGKDVIGACGGKDNGKGLPPLADLLGDDGLGGKGWRPPGAALAAAVARYQPYANAPK